VGLSGVSRCYLIPVIERPAISNHQPGSGPCQQKPEPQGVAIDPCCTGRCTTWQGTEDLRRTCLFFPLRRLANLA
jgi:hypothetical protein